MIASPESDIRRPRPWTGVIAFVLLAVLPACKDKTPTSPTPTTTTPTTAGVSPTMSQEFTGVLPVGGSRFYSFTVEQNGTVNLTLTSVGGTGVPSTLWLGLGIGTPSAEDCATTSTLNTPAGATPQVSGTYAPGIYCARVLDIGNLAAPARFAITIAHP